MDNHNYLTENNPSNGSRNSDEYNMQTRHDDNQQLPSYQVQQHQGPVKQSAHRGWKWGFFGLIAILLIVGAAVWMSHISSSLAQLNHKANQNGRAQSHMNAEMTGIRAQLQHISQQLSKISTQLTTFFGKMMQAISSGK